MADIFASKPGFVYAFPLNATVGQVEIPAEIVDPKFIDKRPSPVIFSTLEWEQKTNQQFANSLDGSVYIYVFGDHMGRVTIRGFAFDQLCSNSGGGDSGLKKVLKYYEDYRASRRQLPLKIDVAGKVVQGFLTGVQVVARGAAQDPAPVLNEYTLEINALP